jgi:hypothetical protein
MAEKKTTVKKATAEKKTATKKAEEKIFRFFLLDNLDIIKVNINH